MRGNQIHCCVVKGGGPARQGLTEDEGSETGSRTRDTSESVTVTQVARDLTRLWLHITQGR